MWWYCAVSIRVGVWSGLIIDYITGSYASHGYHPVQEMAETQSRLPPLASSTASP